MAVVSCMVNTTTCAIFISPLHLHETTLMVSAGLMSGNKYGEPVVCGFTRSFGQRMTADDRRVEWIKPIMFTAGGKKRSAPAKYL